MGAGPVGRGDAVKPLQCFLMRFLFANRDDADQLMVQRKNRKGMKKRTGPVEPNIRAESIADLLRPKISLAEAK